MNPTKHSTNSTVTTPRGAGKSSYFITFMSIMVAYAQKTDT